MPTITEADAKILTKNWRSQNGEMNHLTNADKNKNIVWEYPWADIAALLRNADDNTIGVRLYIGCKNLTPTAIEDYTLLAVLVNIEDDVASSSIDTDDIAVEKDNLSVIYESADGSFKNIDSLLNDSATIGFNRAKKYLKKYRDRNKIKKEIRNYKLITNHNIKAFRFDIGSFYYLGSKAPERLLFTLGYKNKNHGASTQHKHSATLIMTAVTLPTSEAISKQNKERTTYVALSALMTAGKSFDYSDACPDMCDSTSALFA
jgi:hypothetical protein